MGTDRDTIAFIHDFCIIAGLEPDKHNLQAAMKALGLSKSGLYKRVREIEIRLGRGSLFVDTRTFRLTHVGQVLFNRCSESELQMRGVCTHVTTTWLRPSLRIAATGIGIRNRLPTALQDWTRRCPGIPFYIQQTRHDRVPELVASQEVTFGLGAIPTNRPHLQWRAYRGASLVIAYPASERDQEPPTAEDVDRDHPWILAFNTKSRLALLTKVLGRPPRKVVEVGDYGDAALYVRHKLGATFCHDDIIEPFVQQGFVRTITPRRLTNSERIFHGAIMWSVLATDWDREFLECFTGTLGARLRDRE